LAVRPENVHPANVQAAVQHCVDEPYTTKSKAINSGAVLLLNCICPPGELAISCRATGLLMSLTFAKDCSVKGTIEQMPGTSPAAATTAAMAAAATAGGGSGGGKAQLLGTVAGHWTSVINVSCPKLVRTVVKQPICCSSTPC
jgi:hypothetical protein